MEVLALYIVLFCHRMQSDVLLTLLDAIFQSRPLSSMYEQLLLYPLLRSDSFETI